jgi:hypothetical protein
MRLAASLHKPYVAVQTKFASLARMRCCNSFRVAVQIRRSMRSLKKQFTVFVAVVAIGVLGGAHAAPSEIRGELLYDTHCVTCHTTQIHWRNERLAFDWDSLKFQVRRWQGNTGLAWSEADITDVSRYLNETIYQYPPLNDRVRLVPQPKPNSTPSSRGQ